jgi:signal peptidase II
MPSGFTQRRPNDREAVIPGNSFMQSYGPLRVGLGVAAFVAVLDQATKLWIVDAVMQPPRIIPVTPFFNIVMAWNRGVSFGMFYSDSAAAVWILTALALAIVAALVIWLRGADRLPVVAALGLIIGGALGNVADRLQFGAVRDFLDFHAAGYHWPAFNVADACITVGAVLLVLDSLFVKDEKPKDGAGTEAK